MGKKKLPFDILDSIRGIAALYVVIAHCRGVLWIGGSEFMKMFPRQAWGIGDYLMFGTSMLTRLAVEFVIVFFVLSGFSIAHSLSSDKSPLKFYKRRLIRIYPSYFVALIWAILVYVITQYWHAQWFDGTRADFFYLRTNEMRNFLDWDVVLKNLFYMPSNGFIAPFWSLTYEVIFYLLAPFILRRVHVYAIVSLLLYAIKWVAPGWVVSLNLPVYLNDFLFVFNIYFVTGILLYTHYDRVLSWFEAIPGKLHLLFLLFCLGLMYAINIYSKVETEYSFWVAAILSVGLIIYFLKYNVRIRWLMNIGKFSYTLYITHFATIFLYLGIYWLIIKPNVPYILNYFVWIPAVFFSLLIAWIQYLFVEKNTKKVLDRLRKK